MRLPVASQGGYAEGQNRLSRGGIRLDLLLYRRSLCLRFWLFWVILPILYIPSKKYGTGMRAYPQGKNPASKAGIFCTFRFASTLRMSNTLPVAHLEAQICARYQTERLRLELAGAVFHLRVIRNVDALLEHLLSKGADDPAVQDEQIPYWADLWPSALALATHVLGDPRIGPGVQVLELGCGLGLSGTAAGYCGAEVVLTDYLPEALEMAELTWRLNLERPPVLARLDWRRPDPRLAADLILASDVAYEARAHAPLEAAFRRLLRPGGRVLLSEPGRPLDQTWLRSLPAKGFCLHSRQQPVTYQDRLYHIHLHEITLP